MTHEAALALLDALETRQYRLTRKPTRPSELLAQRKDPVAAVAKRLAEAVAILAAGEERPPERVTVQQHIETLLLELFRE